MKRKIVAGLLTLTLAVGGIYYLNTNTVEASDVEISEIDSNKKDEEIFNTNCRYNNLTEEERNKLRENREILFKRFTDEEYNKLSEADKNKLLELVKENRTLNDSEAEKLIKSGDYCISHNITKEEYNKLTDEEKLELKNSKHYCGLRENNSEAKRNFSENRNTNNSYNNLNRANRGHHGKERCQR